MTTKDGHSTEDYLAAIYELEEEGERPIQAHIAKRLGVSRAAVSEQIRRLVRMRLVRIDGRQIRFSAHGHAVAEDAVRKHRIAERFLTDLLGLPWHLAHQEAEAFQGGITEEIERRMMKLFEGPTTCPHGNPIPGTGAVIPQDLEPLYSLPKGAKATLIRLTEDTELDTSVLKYLEEHGVVPGSTLEVLGKSPDGSISLRAGKHRASLGSHLADNLWVRSI